MAVKKSLNFIRTTAIGGLLVIVPISVVFFVLGKLVYALYEIGLAIVSNEQAPDIVAENPIVVMVSALGIVLGVCFVTGLVVRTRIGNSLKNWFDERVAARIPMYKALTSLTERFIGLDGDQFAPVEVDVHSTGVASIGFLIEELPDGRATIFVPTAPMATVGNLFIVPLDRVRRLPASVNQTLGAITQWGIESRSLFEPARDEQEPA